MIGNVITVSLTLSAWRLNVSHNDKVVIDSYHDCLPFFILWPTSVVMPDTESESVQCFDDILLNHSYISQTAMNFHSLSTFQVYTHTHTSPLELILVTRSFQIVAAVISTFLLVYSSPKLDTFLFFLEPYPYVLGTFFFVDSGTS